MNRDRIARLERAAAGLTCRRCGRKLGTQDAAPGPALPPTEAAELARLIGRAAKRCACGRVSVDMARMPDANKRAALVLLRRLLAPPAPAS